MAAVVQSDITARRVASTGHRTPKDTWSASWAVDLVLELQSQDMQVSPAIQNLAPLATVVLWAQQHLHEPTIDEIESRWKVSRATAYRWRPELRRARQAVGK
jgi:hypothetical protein